MRDARVREYMTHDVVCLKTDQTIEDVIKLIKETDHDGFPVLEDGRLVGIITTRDVVLHKIDERVEHAMSKEVVVTYPDTKLMDVARVMFRRGYSRLPVINEQKHPIGIITNMDVLRSHIERVTPGKVEKLKDSLAKLYAVDTTVRLAKVEISALRPTQNRIQPEEFRGREYELRRGLAEPIVVIKTGNRLVLVDGHHRAVAARKLGIETLNAYIIILSEDIELGMERTARKMGLHTMEDITVSNELYREIAEIVRSDDEGR
ncbi:MAG: CBS domain-containing ParB/RepB/Spo0J family partition protein [Candidatus Hydrothermarchaeales archaeon]